MEYIAVVHCHACDFTSTDVKLTRCPVDHEVLGEIMLTREELAARSPRHARYRYEFVPAVVMWDECEVCAKIIATIDAGGMPLFELEFRPN
jgi:hypothetical protein